MVDACQLPPSFSSPQGASHYDELSMKESLIFSDSLKDLKDLRKQSYSAAEYFELSYNGQDHKQIVVNTLRDYATKAFINTVDHLGSMTYKFNCLLDYKIGEASAIELRFSCVQQRRRMCEMFIDHGGLSQQLLAIRTPKHYMRYILLVSKAKDGGDNKNLRYCVTNEVNGEISAGDGIWQHNFRNPPERAPYHSQVPCPTKKQKNAPPHFYFNSHVQVLWPINPRLQTLLTPKNDTHRNPEDPLQCLLMLRGTEELISSYTPAKTKVSSRPCLACGSQERTASCTSSWTRTKKNKG